VVSRLPGASLQRVRLLDGPNPTGNQEHLCQGHGGDREDEHDGAEPDEDGEPSLGWGLNGEKGNASGHDWELDNCDRECDEPALIECSGGAA
jgi:hypothetical protein